MRSPLFLLTASLRRLRLPLAVASLACTGLAPETFAQAPGAAKPNLLADNGGFEKAAAPSENLWDGVTSDGALSGFTFSAQVAADSGKFSGVAMPPAVAFADLNGDGLPDLVTADPTGFFRFYPNSGTPTEPKFTSAEIIPLFVSMTFAPREWVWQWGSTNENQRMCPRFALADWRRSGLLDLLISNYYGEFLFIPNSGNARQPIYKVPASTNSEPSEDEDDEERGRPRNAISNGYRAAANGITMSRVQTNDQNRFWGNLFAPVAVNWGSSGRPDLLVGEGTYSANAIHLLTNIGGEVPKFSNTKHTTIAYGDGREQLLPTVADFNGDGNPDLVVADRSGEVGLYLNPGKPDPNVELKRSSVLSFGGRDKLSGATAPFATDYNGDGLIDLIFGQPNGHIGVALNTGTKTEPKFGPVVDIKGTPKFGRNVKQPPNWEVSTWKQSGHALAYIAVVNAQEDAQAAPPEGVNCLKAGYWPLSGQTFPMPATNIPGAARHFTFYHNNLNLTQNKSYRLSFKVKGAGIERMRYELQTHFRGYPSGMDKVVGFDDRGGSKFAVKKVDEWVDIGNEFTAGSNWTTIEATLVAKYKSPELRGETTMPMRLFVDFFGSNANSVVYFDDFKLVEQ